MVKKRLSRFMAIFFLTAYLFSVNAITVKLGSLAPNGSPWDKGLREISAKWTELSGGKVVLKIYPGGIAGNEDNMLRKMRIGQLGAAAVTGMGLCRVYNGILALQLPLLIRNDEELHYVLDKMKHEFEEKMEAGGFKVLIWSKVGWAHFFSKRPIVVPDDLRAHKQFVYSGDADGIQAWKDAGFNPVPLNVTDLMSSLQSGMVEAYTTTPLSAASYQWFNLSKNMCGLKWAPLIGGIVISTKLWNKIPADIRPALLSAALEIGSRLQKDIDAADSQAISAMKKSGLVVSTVSAEDEKKWENETKKSFSKLAGKSFDISSFNKIQNILKEYRTANEN